MVMSTSIKDWSSKLDYTSWVINIAFKQFIIMSPYYLVFKTLSFTNGYVEPYKPYKVEYESTKCYNSIRLMTLDGKPTKVHKYIRKKKRGGMTRSS